MKNLFTVIIIFLLSALSADNLRRTNEPNVSIKNPIGDCEVQYYHVDKSVLASDRLDATIAEIKCGDYSIPFWAASGKHTNIKLEWINNDILKVTHPQDMDVTFIIDLNALLPIPIEERRDGMDVRVIVAEFNPPLKEEHKNDRYKSFSKLYDCDQAVDEFLSVNTEFDNSLIKQMDANDLAFYNKGLGVVIRYYSGLWKNNEALMKSCIPNTPLNQITPEDVSIEIMRRMLKKVNDASYQKLTSELKDKLKEIATNYIFENLPQYADTLDSDFAVSNLGNVWRVSFIELIETDEIVMSSGSKPMLYISKSNLEVLEVRMSQ